MVTGEKPFPGQNITTVIYKIVNEEPTQPREIDSSIHPGLNDIIMKALAKEPAARYQSCRELFEDLRNYRSLAPMSNPNSTLPSGALVQNNPAPGNFSDHAQLASASRSLILRASSPSQTPIVRRTGAIAPAPEPKKNNVLGTVLAAIFLLAVIIFGAQKIRPVFQAAREQSHSAESIAQEPQSKPALDPVSANTTVDTGTESAPLTNVPAEAAPLPEKNSESVVPRAAISSNSLTPAAAEYKSRIERIATDRHLHNRLWIKGSGTTLMLSGKLRPAEHSELLKFLRSAPAGVQVVDDVQYDDTVSGASSGEDSTSHPAAVPGQAAIHIVTNVIGATASLGAEDPAATRQCETPCGFSGLPAGNYNLQVVKSGFQPVRTALQLEAGKSIDQRIQLEPLTRGLFISSQPAGADVFVNGDKQSGQTPVSLPLAPGKYNLVLRLQGYDAYSGSVEVSDDGQTKVEAELHQKNGHVAWAQVNSAPAGAEIWVDGVTTGQKTPARVEIRAGIHNIMLRLDGYRTSRSTVQASEGGTVNISPNLFKAR